MFSLKNKIGIITGADQGIGMAITKLFAENDATIYACDLKTTALEELQKTFPKVIPVPLNVTDSQGLAALAARIEQDGGKIDFLVNNAGVTRDNLIERMTDDEWDFVIDVNLKAVYKVTQAVLPFFLNNGAGSIINMSSIVGTDGNIGQSNYGATKGGVIAMSKGWSKEFARKGHAIRVNCIAPGFIETPMTVDLPEKVLDYMKGKTVLKRMGKATEIADGALFLASDSSTFITGQVLKIDGGLVL